MRKLLSVLLALALVLGLGLPVLADGEGVLLAPQSADPQAAGTGQDEAAKAVILAVKAALELDTQHYPEFYSDSYQQGEQSWWSLNWSSDTESLSITADGNGKVYSYDRYFYDDDRSTPRSLHFPDYTAADGEADAAVFLEKVLGEGESVCFSQKNQRLSRSYRTNLNGELCLNGLGTGVGVSVSLRSADGALLSFYREDGGCFLTGEVPPAQPAFDSAEALQKLASAVTSRLQWVCTDHETHEVRLMYRMGLDHGTMLDARTGELFQNDGYRYWNGAAGATAEPADTAAADRGLTEAELAGAEKLEGVLDAAALLAAAQVEPAFGLDARFAIGAVRYNTAGSPAEPVPLAAGSGEADEEAVTASYTLTCTLTGPAFGLTQAQYDALTGDGYTPKVVKSITADARTGEVQRLYTSYRSFGWEELEKTEPELSTAAANFLAARYGDYMKEAALESSYQNTWGCRTNAFTYVQEHEGYQFPDNRISVTLNDATGFVDEFSCSWDAAVRFGPSAPVISEEQALSAYLNTYEATLCYTLQPLDQEDWESASIWRLAYAPNQKAFCSQVDAVTGEAVLEPLGEELTICYTDTADCFAAAELEKLTAYGVGYYGLDAFSPDAQVTELDLLLFLLSAQGYRLDYSTYAEAGEEELAWLYDLGCSLGFLDSREQAPERLVTRSQLCRSFVALAGLTEAAELEGIYACGFADDGAIAPADYGYVAIARGLGIVKGDGSGAFRPADGATRQELALMLCRYLSR